MIVSTEELQDIATLSARVLQWCADVVESSTQREE